MGGKTCAQCSSCRISGGWHFAELLCCCCAVWCRSSVKCVAFTFFLLSTIRSLFGVLWIPHSTCHGGVRRAAGLEVVRWELGCACHVKYSKRSNKHSAYMGLGVGSDVPITQICRVRWQGAAAGWEAAASRTCGWRHPHVAYRRSRHGGVGFVVRVGAYSVHVVFILEQLWCRLCGALGL